ncbi:MAG: IPT/TIG domain-containing protein [Flammeovirgaceae bacterium]
MKRTLLSDYSINLALVAFLIICQVCAIAQPTITSFSPISGPVGELVTINGTNFSTTPSNNIVMFGATRATIALTSANQLTVAVPTGATYAPITVLNSASGLLVYSATNFTPNKADIKAIDFYPKVVDAFEVVDSPSVTAYSFQPAMGSAGTTVTIVGTHFDVITTNNLVSFNGAMARVTESTSTSLKVIVPPDATMGKIIVTVNGQSATTANDFIVLSVPGQWVSRSQGLPSATTTASTFASRSSDLLVGTDKGVFISSNNGLTWNPSSNGQWTAR